MRVMVFFDLPTITLENKREYTRFRKFLLKSGFLMMQESVYCKLAPNASVSSSIVEKVRKNKPVQMLTITEKQYAKMEYLVGEMSSGVLDTDERLVIL